MIASHSLSFSKSLPPFSSRIDSGRPPSPPILTLPPRPSSAYPRFSASCTAERESASRPSATAVPSSSPSLYDVLGLHVGATGQEIKAAYRKLARACHPDVVADDRKGTSADLFMCIKAAYATLSDPDKRAEYDRELLLSRRRFMYQPSSSSPKSNSPVSGYARRTWETDQCW